MKSITIKRTYSSQINIKNIKQNININIDMYDSM